MDVMKSKAMLTRFARAAKVCYTIFVLVIYEGDDWLRQGRLAQACKPRLLHSR